MNGGEQQKKKKLKPKNREKRTNDKSHTGSRAIYSSASNGRGKKTRTHTLRNSSQPNLFGSLAVRSGRGGAGQAKNKLLNAYGQSAIWMQ